MCGGRVLSREMFQHDLHVQGEQAIISMYNVYVKLYNLHVQGEQAIISMYSVYVKLYNLHIQGEQSNIYQHINHAHCPGGENSDNYL